MTLVLYNSWLLESCPTAVGYYWAPFEIKDMFPHDFSNPPSIVRASNSGFFALLEELKL
jgi:hypothetical protein